MWPLRRSSSPGPCSLRCPQPSPNERTSFQTESTRERFRPRDRSAARATLGWDPGGCVVLFASDPSRSSKRPELARMACEIASRQVGPIQFQVAHGLAPQLMPEVINASDCLLHPSASEGSPNVVKEALACNLPVVATPVGDIPDLLAGVNNCYVCPPNAADLAAALVRCLAPPRRSDGREHSEQLDESHIAERMARLYEQLAGMPLSRVLMGTDRVLFMLGTTGAGGAESMSVPPQMPSAVVASTSSWLTFTKADSMSGSFP